MTVPVAIPLQGTVITYADDLAAAQIISGMKTISGFDGGASSIEDITTLASTAKEKRSGLIDNGSFTLAGLYNRANVGQAAMLAARTVSASREMVMTFSNGVIATFSAIVVSAPADGSVDESWKVTYTIEIDGAIAWS